MIMTRAMKKRLNQITSGVEEPEPEVAKSIREFDEMMEESDSECPDIQKTLISSPISLSPKSSNPQQNEFLKNSEYENFKSVNNNSEQENLIKIFKKPKSFLRKIPHVSNSLKEELGLVMKKIEILDLRIQNVERHQAQVNGELSYLKIEKDKLVDLVTEKITPAKEGFSVRDILEFGPGGKKTGKKNLISGLLEDDRDESQEGDFSSEFYNQILNKDYDMKLF